MNFEKIMRKAVFGASQHYKIYPSLSVRGDEVKILFKDSEAARNAVRRIKHKLAHILYKTNAQNLTPLLLSRNCDLDGNYWILEPGGTTTPTKKIPEKIWDIEEFLENWFIFTK